ncbi:MAG: DUF5615 family PIN-like protein [Betaproteobacteria bacterium]|nr:DUF5615 family PIN-like protein [Betaproteobacteria bacterium]
MRFLANENFPGDAVTALRAAGHDLAWVRTDAPGSLDPDVLARAVRENRVLLTFDKDFGELAWRAGLPATAGIVLFRLPMPSPVDVGREIAGIIGSRGDWAVQFSVVEPGRVRMRSLPSRS